jgi:hypothetical protein
VVGGVNFRDKSGVLLDDYGHGTGVAGIIASAPYTYFGNYGQGVAPGVKILDLKQESSAGVKAALDWVIDNAERDNIQVVNLTDFITQVKAACVSTVCHACQEETGEQRGGGEFDERVQHDAGGDELE